MFWKLATVKILVYTVKASCVNLVFKLKLAKFIMKMIRFFSSCRAATADSNTRK